MKKIALLSALLFASCSSHSYMAYSPRQERAQVIDESYVHKYGVEVGAGEWQDRGSHGKRIVTLSNGVTVAESYSFGQLDGEVTFTHPYSSMIDKRENYNKGQWLSTEWLSKEGQPLRREEPINDNRTKVTEWYTSMAPKAMEQYEGGKLLEGEYFDAEQAKKSSVSQGNGERLRYSQEDLLLSREKITDGQVAERIDYWENGTPKEVTPYNEQGEIHGLRKSFTKEGEPEKFDEWKNGSLYGPTTHFQGGEKTAEIPYVNGKKQGVERRFLDGGRVIEEVTWINDAQATQPKRMKPE